MSDHTEAATVTVIGWDGAPLQKAAQAALDAATLVIGGARHLDAAALPRGTRTIALGPLAPALAALREHVGPAVVLASGDPGFFGIVRALSEGGLEPPFLRVVPATSAVQTAFSRVGLAWDDALVASMHGTVGGRDLRRAANLCRAHPKVALLTGPAKSVAAAMGGDQTSHDAAVATTAAASSAAAATTTTATAAAAITTATAAAATTTATSLPAHGPQQLAAELIGSGLAVPTPARTLIVAQRLGEADERVEHLTLDQAAARADFAEPNVVLCLAEPGPAATHSSARWLAGWNGPGHGAGPDARPWALPETAFDHRDGQITKPEIRAQILARLGPGPGDLVWDLGAGSGSVGIECARFGAAVVAVERDPESCARISANAVTHGVAAAVSVVCCEAPGVLARLPLPDAVFAGGGGLDVVRGVLPFRPRSIVVALAAVERVGEVVTLLEADGREVGGVLLQSARLAALPGGAHRFAAQNPVFLVWGDLR